MEEGIENEKEGRGGRERKGIAPSLNPKYATASQSSLDPMQSPTKKNGVSPVACHRWRNACLELQGEELTPRDLALMVTLDACFRLSACVLYRTNP